MRIGAEYSCTHDFRPRLLTVAINDPSDRWLAGSERDGRQWRARPAAGAEREETVHALLFVLGPEPGV